jgi:hypothetical protein
MKTFKDAMDEAARQDGHQFGWNDDFEFKLNSTSMRLMYEKAAKLYAQSKVREQRLLMSTHLNMRNVPTPKF